MQEQSARVGLDRSQLDPLNSFQADKLLQALHLPPPAAIGWPSILDDMQRCMGARDFAVKRVANEYVQSMGVHLLCAEPGTLAGISSQIIAVVKAERAS